MIKTTSLMIFIFTLAVVSCSREQIPNLSLPPKTQTGQNTLGFLINNKVWTNFGRRCTFAGCNDNKTIAEFYRQQNGDIILSVNADYTLLSQTIDQSFAFTTTNIIQSGTFILDSTAGHQVNFIASRYTQSYKEYGNTLPNKFFLTITKLDTINKIVSGTFSGVLYNRINFADSINLQDGRFDIKLK